MPIFFVLVALGTGSVVAEPVRVVTTLPVYASIAELVGGDRVEARSISRGDEDAHFVKPKPSFALMLRDADLFVTTGLDLELWAPVLIDKSGNRRIREGQPGYVSASQGLQLAGRARDGRPLGWRRPHLRQPSCFHQPVDGEIGCGQHRRGTFARVDPQGAAPSMTPAWRTSSNVWTRSSTARNWC